MNKSRERTPRTHKVTLNTMTSNAAVRDLKVTAMAPHAPRRTLETH